MMKRGPRKRDLVQQDDEEMIFHKWNMNLKRFWLDHQQVLDELEIDNLTYNTCDQFYNSWIAIINIYSGCAAQWVLSYTWSKPEHRVMKKQIQEQMEHIRQSVYPIKDNIDGVMYDERNSRRKQRQ